MNLNASPDTVRAVAQVFKLAGILDDRVAQPDKARIAAWAEMVQRHKLGERDLLDGLQAYYDSPSERAIQIGDLIHHARIVRRDRNEREDNQTREERIANRGFIAGMASSTVMGPSENRTQRLVDAENALQCCTTKAEAQAAIKEFSEAKREAKSTPAKASP